MRLPNCFKLKPGITKIETLCPACEAMDEQQTVTA
jgi:hypothetical protein